MINIPPQFAETSSSGIGAFNINLKGLIFQLLTFLMVMLVFKRWILPPLFKTMEERRKTLEKSLTQAKETEETLARAEAKSEEIIVRARDQADEALAEAKKAASSIIADAETAAAGRANLIIKEAEASLGRERTKLYEELRGELATLVADATEKIVQEKLEPKRDRSLIERALRGLV